jgi:uncharacterized membrane protein YeaQ/YmgE (transglycosylase-associated protein family)
MYGFLVHLIVAGIVGWVSQRLLGYREIDFLTTLVVGLVGSYIGNGIARWLDLPYAFPGDTLQRWAGMSIPYSIVGCIVFISAINLILRRANNRDKS